MANNANFSSFDPFLRKIFQRLSVKGGRGWAPVVESMRAREPGLQASSNLAGSKTKNTHIFWLIEYFPRLRL